MRVLNATKKHPLSRGHIGCVGDVATLNITRGCAGECAFCYARCYSNAPERGTLWVYQDLPGQLRRELDSRRRRNPLPGYVVVGSAGDAFLGGERVLAATRSCIGVLLRRGVGISLSTRGIIPDEIIEVLARAPDRVHITVPLASMSSDYTETWERGTASPEERLFLVQRLQAAGLEPTMHLEPIIPFVNDDTEALRDVVSAIVGLGLKTAMLSLLQLRRGVAEQLRREAPTESLRMVLGCFSSQQEFGRPGEFDHVAPRQATSILRRAQRIGREHGLRIQACHCHNPGLPAGRCQIAPRDPEPRGQATELFENLDESGRGGQHP
ncbi:MAG: radical SAM protein [Deltaproteobacteria bacterium]|nr:radical SAM protein [Deltaproteobacteria bacterium]